MVCWRDSGSGSRLWDKWMGKKYVVNGWVSEQGIYRGGESEE